MKYVTKNISKDRPEEYINVEKVEKNTTIKHPSYGDILVTPGNLILERLDGPDKGEKVAISQNDLDLQYEPAEE